MLGACVACAGAGVVAACGGGSETPSTTSASSGSTTAAAGGRSVAVADVPVGGSVYVEAGNFIVTQPEAGTFKAFDATCTHERCAVSQTDGDQLKCPCHQSTYDMTSGEPTGGPAPAALTALTATVEGDTVVVS